MRKTIIITAIVLFSFNSLSSAQVLAPHAEDKPSKAVIRQWNEISNRDIGLEKRRYSNNQRGSAELLGALEALKNGDMAEYIKMLLQGAEVGSYRCKFRLAEAYRDGVGVKRDYKKSLMYYENLAKRDFVSAMYMVALYNENGWGTPKDYVKARKLYERAVGKEKHFAEAWRALGSMYFGAKGVERDFDKAMECFVKAASKNNARALFNIALMKEKGMGTKRSMPEAISYYEKAVEAGDIKALHYLGVRYENGSGVKQDSRKALDYYTRAANAGYVESFYRMGFFYQSGRAGKVDYASALQSFARAAQNGHVESYCEIGKIYEKGLGIGADPVAAAKWYGVAADEGNEKGQFLLGLLYMEGRGVPENKTQGLTLIRLAADQGYPEAVTYMENM